MNDLNPAVGLPEWQNEDMAKWNLWDPEDLRLFPQKDVGAGLTINWYWTRHPLGWWRASHA